jgi:hypothetical protein
VATRSVVPAIIVPVTVSVAIAIAGGSVVVVIAKPLQQATQATLPLAGVLAIAIEDIEQVVEHE